ncbi:hypothetical protein KSP39_PZI003045 [Platanthera zijinensis]|uniref:Uncharacterized protein n=1 Tax=Platanthera zijinensis TaxID=2320716 RepID=A0AAP0GCG3_9ASPA
MFKSVLECVLLYYLVFHLTCLWYGCSFFVNFYHLGVFHVIFFENLFEKTLYFVAQGLSRFHQNRSFTHYRLRTSDTLACAKSNKSDCTGVGAPLELWTPEGKFLCSVLKDQPLIFQAAAAKQLDELAFARDSAFARLECSEGSSESCLHRLVP